MRRWFLDTNVVASALLWGGSPAKLIDAARRGDVALFSSIPLLQELSRILARPKFENRLTLAGISAESLVEGYAALLTSVVRPVPISGIAPDPDDDNVIGTALAASAEALVTGDKPFLALRKHGDVGIISVAEAATMLWPGS